MSHEAADYGLAMECAELLTRHYPGYPWMVNADCKESGGIMTITNPMISQTHGYVLHLTRVYSDPERRCVVRAGGEILERGMKT